MGSVFLWSEPYSHYSSWTGRFLTPDPNGFFGDMNYYRYVNNNPLNWIDPSGLIAFAPEYGTSGDNVSFAVQSKYAMIDAVFYAAQNQEATVTFSTNGVHRSNSMHYSGNALDLRTRNMSKKQTCEATGNLKNFLGKDFDVVNEGDHIHLEYDPKKPIITPFRP